MKNTINWLKNNWFKAGILLVILIVGVSLAYYFTIFIPTKERAKVYQWQQEELVEAQKAQLKIDQENQSKLLLESCFNEAKVKKDESIIYWSNYSEGCETYEYKEVQTKCLQGALDSINKAKEKEKEDRTECLRIYPQK